jgi:hypothetical protein
MSQIHDRNQGAAPGSRPAATSKALPLRTIPHFAVPAGATSPIPPALVEAMRTTFTWTPPAHPRTGYTWQRAGEPVGPWEPPAA